MRQYLWCGRMGALMLATACIPACADEKDAPSGKKDAGELLDGGGNSGTGARGGSGGKGGTGGKGGASGTGVWGGTGGGGGGVGGISITPTCSESAPETALTCGGVTCPNPTPTPLNCIFSCCATKGGQEVCGGKDTTIENPVACQPVPVEPDSRCPDYYTGMASEDSGTVGSDSGVTTYKGCCNPANQCGIISHNRFLCVTQSRSVTLPATPKTCDAS